MPVIPVGSLDIPALEPYRNLKDRELYRLDGKFITEGHFVVERLINSSFECVSILVADRMLDRMKSLVESRGIDLPIYVASAKLVDGIVGYKFHTGVLAVGKRKDQPKLFELPLDREKVRLLIAVESNNAANLGSLIRTAAGFGADAVVIGERSVDPFTRLCVRVSMGTIFSLPIIQSDDLTYDLKCLRDHYDIDLIAAVCDDALPIHKLRPSSRRAIVLGAEGNGLDEKTLEVCTSRSTIPMQLGTDSLNVTIAAAVFLYELSRPVD